MSYTRKEVIGDATLYLGDSLSVLPTLGDVDAFVTDPPYGVCGGSGTLGKASIKTKYETNAFVDTPAYVKDVCLPIIYLAMSRSECGVMTPGTPNAFCYPPPQDMGALYQPATTGLNKWGRETTQPVLFYGLDPKRGKTIQAKHYTNTAKASDTRHPCAKPIGVMEWMVDRASLEGQKILDPFMGSGTTGVACANLGRKFVGIEIDETYFNVACERIEAAYAQGRLFA